MSHTTITSICYTTVLRQTFANPSKITIPQARFTFPLYDGVAVGEYTITFGDTNLEGIFKRNETAKKIYRAAFDRGETAGLIEALPAGVFGVTLGNIPPKTDVLVKTTYCGELKHDAAIDGLRYTLPTSIAPRYGDYPGELLELQSTAMNDGGIAITVDVHMGKNTIRRIQSPSHPVAISMGSFTPAVDAAFDPSKASAGLALGSAELAGDFILQLIMDNIQTPQAVIEQHPDLSSRVLMATLVPRFDLGTIHPEIVFIADQSGSIQGFKNEALVSALHIFIKSLPVGVHFNICVFGSTYNLLWPKSQAYNQSNMETAIKFINTFSVNYGATELLNPVRAVFDQSLCDRPLELMLLTDGEIWHEKSLFECISERSKDCEAGARVFALGIGDDVSHTLVEGVARSGNGFAQFVRQDEEAGTKVIRMLKGALWAHTTDYKIEVTYGDDIEEKHIIDDGNEFEIIDRVEYRLNIEEDELEKLEKSAWKNNDASTGLFGLFSALRKPLSFFNLTADIDKPLKSDSEDRYAHLPPIEPPSILQAPCVLPPLFPFNRTTFHLLLGPNAPKKQVKAVTLKPTSPQGPLELAIPVTERATPGTTIHQLAARKAIQELEEGRGWVHSAKVPQGALVKDVCKTRFVELVEREGVRLRELYQVAGKWTSFVAMQDKDEKTIYAVPTTQTMTMRSDIHFCMTVDDCMMDLREDRAVGDDLMEGCSAEDDFMGNDLATTHTEPVKEPGLHSLIGLQTFFGAWHWTRELFFQIGMLDLDEKLASNPVFGSEDVMATALAVAYLETKFAAHKDVWEMVVDKAKLWVGTQADSAVVENLLAMAKELVGKDV